MSWDKQKRKKKTYHPASQVGWNYHSAARKKLDPDTTFWQRITKKTATPEKDGVPVKRLLPTKINHAKRNRKTTTVSSWRW